MPRQNLTSMSVDELLKLRDEVNDALGRRAADLKKELSRLGAADSRAGNGMARRKTAGRKVPAKYRSRKDAKLTWSGRGALPRWMREEIKGTKLKKEHFLIKP